jgi:type IV pilus assembly protein PilC
VASAFQYEAFTRDGETNNGEIIADSLDDARSQLAQQKLIVVTVKEHKKLGVASRSIQLRPNHIKLADIAWMARNLATSQAAGLSMFRALGMLSKQKANQPVGKMLAEVHQQIADGKSLSGAFRAHEAQVGTLTCALVEAGEASGRLDEALAKLADITEARVRLKRKIISAIMYPALVLILALGITLVMLLTVVPTFAGIYKQLGNAKLPAPTQFLLNLSAFLQNSWLIWVPGLIGAVVGVIAYQRSASGARRLDQLSLKVPIFGKLISQTVIARVSAVMASLLSAGVSLLDVLDLSASVAGNTVYQDALLAARDKIREGRPLSRALADQMLFPDVFVQLCAIGEETGAVADLLGRYAKSTEEEVQTTVDGLSSLLEPILIVVLGGIVGGLVISLYLPLFDVVSKVK